MESSAVNVKGENENTLKDGKGNILKKENIYLLITTLIVGILFDVLFYGKPFGISYPVFVLVFYSALLWNFRKSLNFKLDFGWLLSIPVLSLSLAYFIFSNKVFMVLNFIAVPVLAVMMVSFQVTDASAQNACFERGALVKHLDGKFKEEGNDGKMMRNEENREKKKNSRFATKLEKISEETDYEESEKFKNESEEMQKKVESVLRKAMDFEDNLEKHYKELQTDFKGELKMMENDVKRVIKDVEILNKNAKTEESFRSVKEEINSKLSVISFYFLNF